MEDTLQALKQGSEIVDNNQYIHIKVYRHHGGPSLTRDKSESLKYYPWLPAPPKTEKESPLPSPVGGSLHAAPRGICYRSGLIPRKTRSSSATGMCQRLPTFRARICFRMHISCKVEQFSPAWRLHASLTVTVMGLISSMSPPHDIEVCWKTTLGWHDIYDSDIFSRDLDGNVAVLLQFGFKPGYQVNDGQCHRFFLPVLRSNHLFSVRRVFLLPS